MTQEPLALLVLGKVLYKKHVRLKYQFEEHRAMAKVRKNNLYFIFFFNSSIEREGKLAVKTKIN